jgi:hypothetical protein
LGPNRESPFVSQAQKKKREKENTEIIAETQKTMKKVNYKYKTSTSNKDLKRTPFWAARERERERERGERQGEKKQIFVVASWSGNNYP